MHHPRLITCCAAALIVAGGTAIAETLVFDQPETAGIAGYRAMWDTPVATAADGVRVVHDAELKTRGGTAPFAVTARDGGAQPAALAFDAIHRSLLVRFPGAAETLAARLAAGYTVAKAELVLPFLDEELWPEGSTSGVPPEGGYNYRANWGTDKLYRSLRPTWHAVAWGLRQPWVDDPQLGPTYNAYINGVGYWTRFGAQDEAADRVPVRLGPAAVHHEHVTGRLDVTAALNDPAFGATPGERLRRLADCGFLVRKWETYDHRYFTGVYEWSTGTGPRAIVIDTPRLEITLAEGGERATIELPPPADIPALAAALRERGDGGEPTAVMPDREAVMELAERMRFKQPPDMPDWQWQRVQDLFAAAYGPGAQDEPFWYEFVPNHIRNRIRGRAEEPDPLRMYEYFVDSILARPYRGWHGFEAGPVLVTWFLYREALPEPARESFLNYWDAWLMPDRETAATLFPPVDEQDGSLIHPMFDQLQKGSNTGATIDGDSYYLRTGDWRGNKSFYRSGFNYTMSTVNFNNTASMGALLGGAIIDSERAIADGRHGQANWSLRQWTWYDGSSQEEGDDYYFGVTMRAQKMVADFGPDIVDRLLGRSMLLKGMTMLVDTYHPGLRRYITGASRTSPHYRLVTQDGLYSILHTLSREGAFTDLDVPADELPEGFSKFGREFPPDQVARGAAYSPYAPAWYQRVIDDKPFPYEVSATYKRWGHHDAQPLQRKTYLGRHFGLYTMSSDEAFIPSIAQWRRRPETVTTSRELGTLLMRMGINETRFVNDAPGWINNMGSGLHLQTGPYALASYSPWQAATDHRQNITSIQASIALFNYEQPAPGWTITVDGTPVTDLPFTCEPGSRILVRDGVTGIGIIPLPGSDLGGGGRVVLRRGEPQAYLDNYSVTPTLVIDNVILSRDEPLSADADWAAIARAASGFAIAFADLDSEDEATAFAARLREARVASEVDTDAGVHAVMLEIDGHVLEMGARTTRENQDMRMDEVFTHRRVNGLDPDLPPGVERESPFSLHASTGDLEKQGARLHTVPGMHAKLQYEPHTGIVLAANPLAELNDFVLTTPGGIEVSAAGKVGLAFVTVEADGAVDVEHAFLPEQIDDEAAADALLVFGAPEGTPLTLNGTVVTPVHRIEVDGRMASVIPLKAVVSDDETMVARYRDTRSARQDRLTAAAD